MAEIGKFNSLEIVKERDAGVYLNGEDLGEILLPHRYVPENFELGDVINVFIYRDSEDRLIAITKQPFAEVGEFALLRAVAVNDTGAFLNWGLPKDLFVPFREQASPMEEGKSYVVYIYLDENSQRLAASTKINKHLEKINENSEPITYTEGDPVDIMISGKTELGFKAIIENRTQGLIFANEVFHKLQRGEKMTAYIKKIREDGKIDLVLQKPAYKILDKISAEIMEKLEANNDYLGVTDKSTPELISSIFGMSKKTFKKGLGTLYKQRLVTISEDGIRKVEVEVEEKAEEVKEDIVSNESTKVETTVDKQD